MDVSDAAWKLIGTQAEMNFCGRKEQKLPHAFYSVCVNKRILERLGEFLSRTSGLIIWNRSRG
jgi:hypothetical protein